tara:strand:+ start:261 stop:701 length:441 start_codon:yes stop_codon:yes gene_type:complete
MPFCLPRVDDDAYSLPDTSQFHAAPPVPKTSHLTARCTNPLTAFSSGVLGVWLGIASLPVAAHVLGFSSVGIQAGSWAAVWMSKAAVAHGGVLPAWTAVAGLQSVGAAGFATCTAAGAAVMGVGATLGGCVGFGAGWWAARRGTPL